MGTKNNNDLFYICSLIEYIGRKTKQPRKKVADYLGRKHIHRIYEHADVFHCEPIEKVAEELIAIFRRAALIMWEHADIQYRIIGISEKCMNG